MNEVVLITTEDCQLCEQAKEVLARLKAEGLVRVREVPLELSEGRSIALAAAAPFPPVILLDGQVFSYGRLSERKFRKALAARPVEPSGSAALSPIPKT